VEIAEIEKQIRQIPDFPAPGILFMDILPILRSPDHFNAMTHHLSQFAGVVDCVVGIEARGLILGTALALHMDKGFVPLRKAGKLPGEVLSISYGLEYGNDVIEVQKDILNKGERVMLVDDVLATGGTLISAIHYLIDLGATDITMICILSSPEGVAALEKEFAGSTANLTLVTAALDEKLNEKGYIVPGLGDAGDRLYGVV